MNKVAKNVVAFIALIAVSFGIYCIVNHTTGKSIAEAAVEISDSIESSDVSEPSGTAANTDWGYWW